MPYVRPTVIRFIRKIFIFNNKDKRRGSAPNQVLKVVLREIRLPILQYHSERDYKKPCNIPRYRTETNCLTSEVLLQSNNQVLQLC